MADWKWEYPKEPETGGHSTLAALVRGGAPLLSSEGGLTGSLISGGAETIAEMLEGANPFNNWKRIGVEAGIGAVPLGKIIKEGKILSSAVKSGALSGSGEAMREAAKDEDFSAGKIAASTGIGAVTGGVGAHLMKILGVKGLADEAEAISQGRTVTTTGNVPKGPKMPSPTVQQGPFTHTGTTWPMPIPAHTRIPSNLEGLDPALATATRASHSPAAMGGGAVVDEAQGLVKEPTRLVTPNLSQKAASEVGNGGGLRVDEAPGLLTTHGQPALGEETYGWAKAVGVARKMGLDDTHVVQVGPGKFKIASMSPKTTPSPAATTDTGFRLATKVETEPPAATSSIPPIERNALDDAFDRTMARSQRQKDAGGLAGLDLAIPSTPIVDEARRAMNIVQDSPTLASAKLGFQKNTDAIKAEAQDLFNKARGNKASVPFMVTNAMKAELRARGITPAQYNKMTPQEVQTLLNEEKGVIGGKGGMDVLDTANAKTPQLPRVVPTSKKTVAELREHQGVTAGNAPYDPEQGTPAIPISGAIQAYPEGTREGYLFGQHRPQTLIKAENAGDTIVKPEGAPGGKGGFTIGSGLGGAQGIGDIARRNRMFSLRLAGAGIGGLIGASTGDEDHRLQNAAIYAGLGALAPSIPKVLQTLGVKAKSLEGLDLTTEDGARDALGKLMHTIPQVQRFNYLASASGLPANALVGPYGAALMGAVERKLSGDPRAGAALSVLKNPAKFIEMFQSPQVAQEAERLMTEGHTMERMEQLSNSGFKSITDKLSLPGKLMTRGDVVARKILMDAGFTEQEARTMTLTAEPLTKLFKQMAHGGSGSAVGAILAPFRRTPANMGERGLERIPGVGVLAQMRRAPGPGGVKTPMDSWRQMAVQQGLGTGVGLAGYEIGKHTDPENAKFMRKYLTNLSGMYSLPMAMGLAGGQASQYGENPFSFATAGAIRDTLPLPTTQSIEDIWKFLTSEEHPVPRGAMPQDLYDYLQNQ